MVYFPLCYVSFPEGTTWKTKILGDLLSLDAENSNYIVNLGWKEHSRVCGLHSQYLHFAPQS